MDDSNPVTAIVLAAGLSSRMKSCKLNLPFKKHTIIEEVLFQLLQTEINEIIVVTGHYKDSITSLIPENKKIKCVHNAEYHKGMTTSIQLGVKSSSKKASGYMICLGDMPFIETADYNVILKQFLKNNEDTPSILRPFHKDLPGNPTIFSHHFKDDILALEYMEGAKPLLKKFSKTVVSIVMETDHIIRDIDTTMDYERTKGY